MRFCIKEIEKYKIALVHKTRKVNVARKKKVCNKHVVNYVSENLLYASDIIKWESKVVAVLMSRS